MVMYCYLNLPKRRTKMQIHTLFSGYIGSNCYVLISEDADGARHAAVIDPSDDAERISEFIYSRGASLDFILLTHGHFDHVTEIDRLRNISGAPAYIHKDDAEMLTDGNKNASAFFFGKGNSWKEADRLLDGGDILALGNEKMKVISTPGHSRGSICLLCDGFMITGDTLFADGYGRYDLYGGDASALRQSLDSLRAFDQSLTIYPGHGCSEKLGRALDNTLYF